MGKLNKAFFRFLFRGLLCSVVFLNIFGNKPMSVGQILNSPKQKKTLISSFIPDIYVIIWIKTFCPLQVVVVISWDIRMW